MTEVFCKKCGTKLDEPSNTPIDRRQPCPKCDSLARTFRVVLGRSSTGGGSVTVAPPTIRGKGTVYPPTIVVGPEGPSDESKVEEAIETLEPIVHSLQWLEPTDENGSWTLQAFDGHGEQIAMTEAFSWEEALLAIAEKLDPTTNLRDE